MARNFIIHARAMLVLGLPLIGSHLAQMALHVSDTMLLGRYGSSELAAVTPRAASAGLRRHHRQARSTGPARLARTGRSSR